MGNVKLWQAQRQFIHALMVILGFCCVFLGSTAVAQLDQGAITGTVKDSTGAIIPHTQVTLTNTDTNLVLHDTSDANGEYVFSPIKIGNYKISATASGFATTIQENVRVNIQDRLNIDLTLKAGAVMETVTVTSAPPPLQTESSAVGQVMSTDAINATPLNGRNWVYIAQLAAGVAPAFASSQARGGGTGDFSANGQRTTQNNFILDGVDNNVNVDDFQNGASYNVKPPPDALAEFKLDTSNYSAEFGHSAGAVLNASIKSGTNQIHGDVWEYVRNTAFDAQDWNALTIPAYHQNQFGATLGLPILKNKIFYFGDAEASRIAYAQPSATLTVPTAAEREGDFSEWFETNLSGKSTPVGIFAPNTAGQLPLTATATAVAPAAYVNPAIASPSLCATTPQLCAINGVPTTNVLTPGEVHIAGGSATGEVDTVAHEIMALFPMPNTGNGQLYNNYNVNLPVHDDTWQWDQRLDWNISPSDQTYVRYSYTHEQATRVPPFGILDGSDNVYGGVLGNTDFNLGQSFMGSESHFFSPSLVNELRFGYNVGNFQNVQFNNHNPASTLVPGLGGIPFGNTAEANGGLPYFRIGGAARLSSIGSHHDVPSVEHQNIYQILDNVTKVVGRHALKFGMQLESIRTSFSQSSYPRGSYNFHGGYSSEYNVGNTGSGMADMFTDNQGNAKFSPGWNTSYYRWYRSFYAQDDFKVNHRLTLNLGVRYDYIQPMSSKPGDVANLEITSAQLTAQGAGTSGTSATGTGSYVMSTLVQGQNLLPVSFISALAADNVGVTYLNSKSLVTTQKDNFAPRIGFAYQLDPKTVVRGGYGIFYGAIEAPGGAELTVNFPFEYLAVISNKYLGSWACLPSVYSGADNVLSQCPSNGTSDTQNGSTLPYPTDLEIGFTNYFNNGGLASYGVGNIGINMADASSKTPYTQSYNLTVQRQLSRSLVASLGYVGNSARHTFAGVNANDARAVTNTDNTYSTSPFPDLYLTADSRYIGEAMYNGLQATIEKRPSQGLSFLATYTWSHAMDDASNPGIGGGPSYRNSFLIPLKDEFTNANYDVRHRVTVNGMYDLPFGKGKTYVRAGGVLDYLIGGWSASLTWVAQTGNPIAIGPGSNFVGANGADIINAIRIGDPFKGGGTPAAGNPDTGTCPASVRNRTNWYNPCAFVDPVSGIDPSLGITAYLTDTASAMKFYGGKTNQIYGPGYERVNMSLFKNIKTWREQFFQFRADVFNLFNHPSWGNPSDTSLNPTGGNITGPQSFQNLTPDARFFQLSGKYVF